MSHSESCKHLSVFEAATISQATLLPNADPTDNDITGTRHAPPPRHWVFQLHWSFKFHEHGLIVLKFTLKDRLNIIKSRSTYRHRAPWKDADALLHAQHFKFNITCQLKVRSKAKTHRFHIVGPNAGKSGRKEHEISQSVCMCLRKVLARGWSSCLKSSRSGSDHNRWQKTWITQLSHSFLCSSFLAHIWYSFSTFPLLKKNDGISSTVNRTDDVLECDRPWTLTLCLEILHDKVKGRLWC